VTGCGCKGLLDRKTGLLIQCATHQAEWLAHHTRALEEHRNGNITLPNTAQTEVPCLV
jgi:hypothetical protein